MDNHTKSYSSFTEMLAAVGAMQKFQSIHNVLRKDYIELLRITEANKLTKNSFDAMYRASIRSLFSLMEADITGLNILDGYPGYDDRKHTFLFKFKKTYKQIAKTWNKEKLQQSYFDSKLSDLIVLKNRRDDLVHPKEHSHLHEANIVDFEQLQKVFQDYDHFINEMMNDFFVGTSMPIDLSN